MIYYNCPRPKPVIISKVKPVTDRALLPLVSHPGAFASQRKWDDKGTFHIKKSKTPRFDVDSYYGEKPYLLEQPSPRPVQGADFGYNRSPSHVFPGLKKQLDPTYMVDKKALFKKII